MTVLVFGGDPVGRLSWCPVTPCPATSVFLRKPLRSPPSSVAHCLIVWRKAVSISSVGSSVAVGGVWVPVDLNGKVSKAPCVFCSQSIK